jgi:hypothetical protein
MPRAQAEKLLNSPSMLSDAKGWRCSSCGAIGHFASESSPEWVEFANDLVFEAYAAHLQKAGYEVEVYSVGRLFWHPHHISEVILLGAGDF